MTDQASPPADAAAPDAAPVEPAAAPGPSTRASISLVLVAAFLVLADVSILNIAAPTIERGIGASFGEIQLVLAGYQVAYAAVLVTGGRLGDILGIRTAFSIGVGFFAVSSAACAAAGSPEELIAFRVAQGAAAALMYPQVLATMMTVLAPERRAGALAALGAVASVATIAGPLITAVLIDPGLLDASWRWVFLINVPIGLVALVLAQRLVPASRQGEARRLDLASVVVLAGALVCVMLPLTVGRERGWPAWSIAMLVAVAPLLLAFVRMQFRLDAAGRDPLLPPSLWRDRAFRLGVALYLALFIGVVPFFLYYYYVLQIGLGVDALEAALSATPYALGAAVASIMSRRWIMSGNPAPIAIRGALIAAAGTATMIVPLRLIDDPDLGWAMIPSMVVTGVGIGFVIAPVLFVVLMNIRSGDAGAAAGLLATAQQVGGATGVALLGLLVFEGRTTDTLATLAYDDLADGFTGALVAIVVVFLIAAALLERLRRQQAAG